ncbi:hypothetical protein TMGG_03985, partial [Mycobacterium tuberculosis SUMu007]
AGAACAAAQRQRSASTVHVMDAARVPARSHPRCHTRRPFRRRHHRKAPGLRPGRRLAPNRRPAVRPTPSMTNSAEPSRTRPAALVSSRPG